MLSTIILYMHVRSVYNFANIMKISVSRLEEISKCFWEERILSRIAVDVFFPKEEPSQSLAGLIIS